MLFRSELVLDFHCLYFKICEIVPVRRYSKMSLNSKRILPAPVILLIIVYC